MNDGMVADDAPLSLSGVAERLASGRLRSVAFTEALLERIGSVDPLLHSVLHLDADAALNAAHAADRARSEGRLLGPLHGVPLGVKDIFDVEGQPTTANSRTLVGNIAVSDAVSIRRLREAGAFPLAKLTTHEFAIGGPSFDLPWPPARNPWDRDRFTGGSSSGSAAGIAAALFPGATGSDTGGSIRVPAALTGVAGIKPSYGLVSRQGVVPLAFSLDTVGPMAWTVEDCALLLAAMVEPGCADPRGALDTPIEGMRIGFARHIHDEEVEVEPEMRACLDDVAARLRRLGAVVEEVRLPSLAACSAVVRVILTAEAFAIHEAGLATRPQDYGEMFRLRVLGGALLSAADYLAAQRERTRFAALIEATLAPYGAVLTAIAPGVAPTMERQRQDRNFSRPFLASVMNVSGGPGLTLCAGFSAAGLPLGVQLIGASGRDAAVLGIGHQLERDLRLRGRRPTLQPG